ncbi:hypothetical protein [Kaistia terrae]|uniref:Uncharacterized protein n=1 Tax=Kaistia terrae TaxID=537017 RepID=A0ABW0PZH5_9HYPH|nr:hypothetical protein [Kaistia terrae]MCX5581682.1 hypothetical protein [Kaistia terrae]
MIELVLDEVMQADAAHGMLDVDLALSRIFPVCVAYGDPKSDIQAALTKCALEKNVGASFRNRALVS